jgi:glycosyltransferase involved in cell wall biosynthesis
MKLSIIVPCYNESKNIPLILEKFASVIKRDDVEVILVNNGSTDGSQMVLDELLPKYPFFTSCESRSQ